MAVFLSLKHFSTMGMISYQQVLVRSNNSCVAAHISKKGGACLLPLLCLRYDLLQWSSIPLLSLRTTHVLRVLNHGADGLSRGLPLAREWHLHPEVVQQREHFSTADADLFASREHAHCPTFFSIQDVSAPLGIDVIAPVALILPTLGCMRKEWLNLILVATQWPKKAWVAKIMSLLEGEPWHLPVCKDLLTQAHSQIWHPHAGIWYLWLCTLRKRN